MSKRLVATYTFAIAAIAVLVGFSIQSHHRADRSQRLLEQTYLHAFTELTTAAGELDTALEKALYATPGPLQTSLYQQIYAKSQTAQAALGLLPYANVQLEQTSAFFAKAGDYALALTRGGTTSDPQALSALSDVSHALRQTLEELQTELENGKTTFDSLRSALSSLSAAQSGEAIDAASFQTSEADFPEMPALVYDGPFSEHLSAQTPKMLAQSEPVTQSEAARRAADFLHVKEEALSLISVSGGTLPTYSFSLPQTGGQGYIELTCQGGQVLSYFLDRSVKAETITVEEGVILAENFLVNWGFPQMEHSYTICQGGRLTVHFAPVMDGVYCYPDLVKVTLALDDGSLLGYEAHGYLSNHTDRVFPSPAVTPSGAAAALPDGLTILSSQLALIPTSGGTEEVLTYEFKTENSSGQHILLYINAQTGVQQNILLLLEDASGTLAL